MKKKYPKENKQIVDDDWNILGDGLTKKQAKALRFLLKKWKVVNRTTQRKNGRNGNPRRTNFNNLLDKLRGDGE